MPYSFRYRVRTLAKPNIPETNGFGRVALNFSELPTIHFETADAHPAGKWVTFRVEGFQTKALAQEVGRRFGSTLLLIGALDRLGIDVGHDRPHATFTPPPHYDPKLDIGKKVVDEVHGLMVYEGTNITTGYGYIKEDLLLNVNKLQRSFSNLYDFSYNITERQRNCAALLNDSFFISSVEGQFVLRVSAIEALCNEKDVGEGYKKAIVELMHALNFIEMEETIREVIQLMLSNARDKSVRQSYLRKFRSYNLSNEANEFDRYYGMRSTLLHAGVGRGTLGDANNRVLELSNALLEAELKAQTPRPRS
jgi:hypothetical protein